MATAATEANKTQLLIIEREQAIIPVASTAFQVAQTSESKLNEMYRGAVLISRDGKAHSIERIRVLGLYGDSLGRKFRSALFGTRRIATEFRDVAISLEQFKSQVVRYLGYDSQRGAPYLPQDEALETVYGKVRASRTFAEVFENINVPPPEDALDVF